MHSLTNNPDNKGRRKLFAFIGTVAVFLVVAGVSLMCCSSAQQQQRSLRKRAKFRMNLLYCERSR